MTEFAKHFTLQAARAQLPDLRRWLLRIGTLLAEIRARQAAADAGPPVILRGNGKGPIIDAVDPTAQHEEAQRLIEEIAALGIQIKDLEQGLVDFPHFLNGDPSHEVFLCWRLGEDTIEYWHEIADGFGGRRPL